MPQIPVLQYVSSWISVSILLVILILATTPSRSLSPPATSVIDFEALNAPGSDAGGLRLRTQFAAIGVIFQPTTVFDYSQETPIPNFAHSGTKAIELCHAVEFCREKLELSFTAPQRRVKLWVGYSAKLETTEAVMLRAFDRNGNEVVADVKVIGPSTGVIPIRTPLEVTLSSPVIARVTVGFNGAEPNIPRTFNNHLAIDDIEFDDQGPPPQCSATQPPTLMVNQPATGKVVIENAFTFDGNITTSDPFATLEIKANPRIFGPVAVASGHVSFFNISDLLSPGTNIVVITVRDCAGSKTVARTIFFRKDVKSTVIRVVDEGGLNVAGAGVYANANLLGNTDQFGLLRAMPPLRSGTALVARKLVKEHSTLRRDHRKGSIRNWNYRIYISNLEVDNNGRVIPEKIEADANPVATKVLRVRRRNTLFGLHVVASLEWDASIAEMETVRQKLIDTSKYLYNATDGQMLIEQAEVVDDAKYWQDADYRIYANQSFTPYVDWPLGGFFNSLGGVFNFSRIHVRILDVAPTYAHEFGHYGLGVSDEYKLGDSSIFCTHLLRPPGDIRFRSGSPQASCMMYIQTEGTKLCSSRIENPHVKGTRQGDASCWSTFSGNYRDTNSTPRWILQTPDTRAAIPGLITGPITDGNLLEKGWAPRFTFENGVRPNLCAPMKFRVGSSQAPVKDFELWLRTTYGADILEGETNAAGELTATGLHVDDTVSSFKIRPANCTPVVGLLPAAPIMSAPASAVTISPVGFSQRPETATQLDFVTPAFNLFTILKPVKREAAEIMVRVEAISGEAMPPLPKPPTARVKLRGQKAQSVWLRYRPEVKDYVGTLARLPVNGEMEIEVQATDAKGQTVGTVGRFKMSRTDSEHETDVMSSDGQVSLTIPARALPAGARVAIGPPSTRLSALPDGYSVLGGAFSLWSFPDNELHHPGTLRFQLPHQDEDTAAVGYPSNTFRIFHYDAKSQKWEDLGGIVHPPPIDIVVAKTRQLGMFALGIRTTDKKYPQSALFVDWLRQIADAAHLEICCQWFLS
jgi:hypothetical protein